MMPYQYIEPEVFVHHRNVTVWHTYGSPDDGPSKFWFTTDETTADNFQGHGKGGYFDARMLASRWSTTPTVGEWDEFWKPRFRSEDDAIEALIISAIEDGRIPHGSAAK